MFANWIGFPVSFVYFQNSQYSLFAPLGISVQITSEWALHPFNDLETSAKDSTIEPLASSFLN